MPRTTIVSEPILPGEILSGLPAQEDGAVLLFLGVVRDHNLGRAVSGLEYDVYQGMAEKVLAEIAGEASEEFGTDRIVAAHRIGHLRVGEVSTAIAVATPHREEAYAASRYIIEELKRRLPVWKKEHYSEGDTDWVGNQVNPGGGEGEFPGEGVAEGE